LPALNNRDLNANNLLDMFDFKNPNMKPYIYQSGSSSDPNSSFYHNINGEIDLNVASKVGITVTLMNTADHKVQTAALGQIRPSEYGDYGLTASINDNGKLQYHFQVPAGTYIVTVRSENKIANATINANSANKMTYNGVTFYDDKSDLKLQYRSNNKNDGPESSRSGD
jgi:hypothetical protein